MAASAGVGGKSDEPIGNSFGEVMKGFAFSTSVATDLALVKDQRQGIGQKADHRQHDERRGSVDSRMFEIAVCGDGLKHFRIDSPAAAAELMDEQRRNRAEFEIGGVEIGALLGHRRGGLGSMASFFSDRDAAPVIRTNRFDDSYQTIGNGPVDLW